LRDFETLTLLYRIKSYDFEVRALAFSGDGLRLVDIRDSRSKIWEPAALVRKTIEEDVDVRDTAIIPVVTVGLDYFNEILNITCLAAHPNRPVVFAGKSDGSVVVYNSRTGTQISFLYSHTKDAFISAVACNEKDILATADAGGVVQVWQLAVQSDSWNAKSQIVGRNAQGAIKQLLFSPDGTLLLVSSTKSAIVWSTSTGCTVGECGFDPTSRTVWRWFSTPGDQTELTHLVDARIERYSWTEFPSMLADPSTLHYDATLISDRIEIETAVLDPASNHLIIDFRKHCGNRTTTQLLTFPYASQDPPREVRHCADYLTLAARVKYFIGISSSDLVFIDRESWLSSVDLHKFNGNEYTRHFYVPNEVFAGNTGVTAVLTATGDVAFAKEGELGVVRSGRKFRKVVKIELP
jgi:WD40 repeat protein